jgi:hypothetical protein
MSNNKTLLIIAREYITRVRKKSFIIITILMPILIAALIALPTLLVLHSEQSQHTSVLVVDDTEIFINGFENTDNVNFSYISGNVDQLKKEAFEDEKYDCVLHILDNSAGLRSNLYYREHIPTTLQSSLEGQMDEIFFNKMLQDSLHITPDRFAKLQELTKSSVTTIQVDDEGVERENIAEMNEIVGMMCGFFIYFVIIIFASQVLRGVLEEKTNRIVEVLVSSVKPMQLLVGKIVGIALVGITQFLIWIVLTFGLVSVAGLFVKGNIVPEEMAEMTDGGSMGAINNADFSVFQKINEYFSFSFSEIILCFFFFFVVGYLIYATLYAATGSVVDNESDSQQYTMPVTIPLILAIILIPTIATNPSGQLAFWFSMIPLTSPITMMVRLPAGVPFWQLLTSMGVALLFLLFCIWFVAKIYRVGILMYGKKPSWREIFKWLRKA